MKAELTQDQKNIARMTGMDPEEMRAKLPDNDGDGDADADGNDDDPDEIDQCLNHLSHATDPDTDESLKLGHVKSARDALNRHLDKFSGGDADANASAMHVRFPQSR